MSDARISYALLFDSPEPREWLKQSATEQVIAEQYEQAMEGRLACPECKFPLVRIPKNKPHTKNMRKAYYAHSRGGDHIPCGLRANKPEGKYYLTEESAMQAIENKQLVIISGFMQDSPELPDSSDESIYSQTAVESIDGPVSEVPIARHTGGAFALPSVITTVGGICRNFEDNLKKYYHFPGMQHAISLSSFLKDVRTVEGLDDTPRLYYGKALSSTVRGGGNDWNIRMIFLNKNIAVNDFCLKIKEGEAKRKNIALNTIGRNILMYGKVTKSGIGYCIENLGWGEYAVLPEKYDYLLDELSE